MALSELTRILADLRGTDLASQIEALERFFDLPSNSVTDSEREAVVRSAVNVLELSSNPYPIAERLLRFREEIVSPLSALFMRLPMSEVKTLAALVLTSNGSRLGVEVLIEEIECGGDYLVMASLALANAGFTEHVPAVLERLRRWSLPPTHEFSTAEDDMILRLLEVLDKLRMPIPEDLMDKFSAPQASAFFRSAVEWHRGGGPDPGASHAS